MLYGGACAVLLLIWAQSAVHILPTDPLKEERVAKPDVEVGVKQWWNGDLQEGLSEHLRTSFGFRPFAVRLVNQLRLSLFDEITDGIEVRAEGHLFLSEGKRSVCGEDFLGEAEIDRKIDSLERFYNALRRQDKELVIFLLPNKWRTLKREAGLECRTSHTNYAVLQAELRSRGFAVCDAIGLFQYDHSIGTEFPLHAKQGADWSVFGASWSVDYLRYTFSELGIQLPPMQIEQLIRDSIPRSTDRNLHDRLNVWQGPFEEELGYPTLRFQEASRPRVVVIGDSAYLSYMELGAHQGLFADESVFLLQNLWLIDGTSGERTLIDDHYREACIAKSDVVMLVLDESSLSQPGFDITEWAQ